MKTDIISKLEDGKCVLVRDSSASKPYKVFYPEEHDYDWWAAGFFSSSIQEAIEAEEVYCSEGIIKRDFEENPDVEIVETYEPEEWILCFG